MKDKTKLRARWSKKEKDLLFSYPQRCDGHYLYWVFCAEKLKDAIGRETTFVQELEQRGYDITTLKFEIKLKSETHQ